MTQRPQFLIGGRYRDTTDHAPIEVVNPCTEEVLWTCPQCGPEHVNEAVEHAKAVQRSWGQNHGSDRAVCCAKWQ